MVCITALLIIFSKSSIYGISKSCAYKFLLIIYITLNVYLDSLVCRCPFVGETDRATLLRVGEGTLNWDAPDVTYRSPDAQNFLHMLLQPDPE